GRVVPAQLGADLQVLADFVPGEGRDGDAAGELEEVLVHAGGEPAAVAVPLGAGAQAVAVVDAEDRVAGGAVPGGGGGAAGNRRLGRVGLPAEDEVAQERQVVGGLVGDDEVDGGAPVALLVVQLRAGDEHEGVAGPVA